MANGGELEFEDNDQAEALMSASSAKNINCALNKEQARPYDGKVGGWWMFIPRSPRLRKHDDRRQEVV